MPVDERQKSSGTARWGRAASALAVGAIILLAGPAALAASSARLVYTRTAGAEECPDQDALRSAVAARLGYDPFVREARETVVARIGRDGEVWRAQVALVDDKGMERGARRLETASPDCADLITAMALTISIAVDPLSVIRPPPAVAAPERQAPAPEPIAPPPEPTAPAPAPVAPVLETPVASTPAAQSAATEIEPFVGLGLRGSLNIGAGPAFGGLASVGVRWRSFSLALEAGADAPSSAPSSQGGRVETFAGLGSIVPCAHYRRLFACAVGTLGSITARGAEISAPRTGSALYGGAGARIGASIPLGGRLDLVGFAGVLASLARFTVTINGVQVFRAAPIAGDLGAAVRLRF
jgi:hypothetical protein